MEPDENCASLVFATGKENYCEEWAGDYCYQLGKEAG